MTEKTQKQSKKETEEKDGGIATLKKSEIEGLLKRMDALEKDREMLLQIADKKQLAQYYDRHKESVPNRVMLRMLKGKVILGWKTTEDEVYQDPDTMRWIERQKVKVMYEDGTSEELHLRDYVRNYKQVEAEVKSKITDEATGALALKVVRLDTGKEYTISVTFVN